ncbi:MAG: hypothetical protein IPK79_09845 [Vampirovibrionales bacterium]|nr:hypothetical protein [Vampirovibrionales bacterium]
MNALPPARFGAKTMPPRPAADPLIVGDGKAFYLTDPNAVKAQPRQDAFASEGFARGQRGIPGEALTDPRSLPGDLGAAIPDPQLRALFYFTKALSHDLKAQENSLLVDDQGTRILSLKQVPPSQDAPPSRDAQPYDVVQRWSLDKHGALIIQRQTEKGVQQLRMINYQDETNCSVNFSDSEAGNIPLFKPRNIPENERVAFWRLAYERIILINDRLTQIAANAKQTSAS